MHVFAPLATVLGGEGLGARGHASPDIGFSNQLYLLELTTTSTINAPFPSPSTPLPGVPRREPMLCNIRSATATCGDTNAQIGKHGTSRSIHERELVGHQQDLDI